MTRACFGLSQPLPLTYGQNRWGSHICIVRPPALPKTTAVNAQGMQLVTSMAAEPPATELLVSTDFLERIRGINRVDEIDGTSEKLSALIPMATGDPNQQVRYAAVSRIASLDPASLSEDDARNVLDAARFVLVNDKESSCQSGAADLIAGLKLTDGFDDLVDTFNRTSDWMLKFSIAAGLGEMGDPKAFDFLTSILDNDDGSDTLLITAAIGALGELGDQRGVPIVERYLDNEDSSVRERATIAHGMLLGTKPSA